MRLTQRHVPFWRTILVLVALNLAEKALVILHGGCQDLKPEWRGHLARWGPSRVSSRPWWKIEPRSRVDDPERRVQERNDPRDDYDEE